MTMQCNRCSIVATAVGAVLVCCTTTAGWAQLVTSDPVALRGAGSTFAAPLYWKWIEKYAGLRPNVSISCDAVGSDDGVRRFLADAVDFAGSDEILNDRETAEAGGAIMVPVTAGMVVIAYNVPGLPGGLKLPRDVYLDIFAGIIQQWDDARIQAANPGIAFPHRAVGVIAREDGSGTTAAFTRHLDAIGSTWRSKGMTVGNLIGWPKGTTLAQGNEGVASKIQATEGSIGYVDATLQSANGNATEQGRQFVARSASSGDLPLSGRVAQVKQLDVSVADSATSGAYPIPSYSWMLLYPHYRDKAKGAALNDLVEWGLSQQAQDTAAELGYLALPADVLGLGTRSLAGLTYSK